MILQIPITEALSLIKNKTGKTINMSVVNSCTINIGYQINVKVPILGAISKNVYVDVAIDKVENNDIFLHYSIGMPGADTIINTLLAFFATDIRVVEKNGASGLVIHLREIEEARDMLDKIDMKSVSFEEETVLVGFVVKEL